jgi:hypothetical protein
VSRALRGALHPAAVLALLVALLTGVVAAPPAAATGREEDEHERAEQQVPGRRFHAAMVPATLRRVGRRLVNVR